MKKQKPKLFNELPKKVSQNSFNNYIKPYLRKPVRGPKPTVSLYKIFNYILYVLYTRCQWNKLPIQNNEIHWSNIYKWHNRWSKNGSYEDVFLHSITVLRDKDKLDLSIIHGDGTNTVAKKGAKE